MWMGGNVPLGHDANERTLVINPVEAETVRRIFALYRELGCVHRVKEGVTAPKRRTCCERVRFAMTLRWREVDSNHRSLATSRGSRHGKW
jgi:hypothetical protein